MTTISINTSYIYGYSENISDLLAESLIQGDVAGSSEWSYQDQKINNPKITFFEQRIAALEGGVSAMAVKSFYYAKIFLLRNILKAGDNIVTYNSSTLYHKDRPKLNRLGIDVKFSEDLNLDSFKNLFDENTKLVYLETVGIENSSIPDFQKIIAFAKQREIPVVVDNTAGAAGYITSPIKNGANIVIESTKNWLPSHKDIIGAVIIDGGNYNWKNGKFSQFSSPYQYINAKPGNNPATEELPISLINYLKKQGNINYNKYEIPKNPLSLIHDLENLPSIVQDQNNNALELAQWLEKKDAIKVNYTGLPSHKDYFTALTYFRYGFGHELSFALKDENQQKNLTKYLFEKEPLLKNNLHLQKNNFIKFSFSEISLERTQELLQKAFDQLPIDSTSITNQNKV
jgi:O-acetylhomoserine/O-acetylserine sulfhydrylase